MEENDKDEDFENEDYEDYEEYEDEYEEYQGSFVFETDHNVQERNYYAVDYDLTNDDNLITIQKDKNLERSKYQKRKEKSIKNLSLLSPIKEEDEESKLSANKSLSILNNIGLVDARYLSENVDHNEDSFNYFELHEKQISGFSKLFNDNDNLINSNNFQFSIGSPSNKFNSIKFKNNDIKKKTTINNNFNIQNKNNEINNDNNNNKNNKNDKVLKSFGQEQVLSLTAVPQTSVLGIYGGGERILLATLGSNQFFLSPTAIFCCWNLRI
jgi:hypothetical protein